MKGCPASPLDLHRAPKVANELIEAADEKMATKTIARYSRMICSASMSFDV